MKTILKLNVFAFLATGLMACSSTSLTDKPMVQAPLKLSEAGTALRQTCGSYGCDDTLRSRCNGSDFRILNQNTRNKHNSKKNYTTGNWENSRTETVDIVFKCLSSEESASQVEK